MDFSCLFRSRCPQILQQVIGPFILLYCCSNSGRVWRWFFWEELSVVFSSLNLTFAVKNLKPCFVCWFFFQNDPLFQEQKGMRAFLLKFLLLFFFYWLILV